MNIFQIPSFPLFNLRFELGLDDMNPMELSAAQLIDGHQVPLGKFLRDKNISN
jgi:hypothetical protein